MLEDLFGRSQYVDFPSFEVAVFSLLLAFVLSTVIALTYRWTYEGHRFPRHFFQAMVLSSTVTSMVIMAVGNNIAAGFGILGAVAIIRFRTLVRDPRNIIFIFASLSIGIATGVYGYAIALAGTLIFCSVAILLHYSPFGLSNTTYYDVVFNVGDENGKNNFMSFLKNYGAGARVLRIRTAQETNLRYAVRIALPGNVDVEEFFLGLMKVEGVAGLRFSESDNIEL